MEDKELAPGEFRMQRAMWQQWDAALRSRTYKQCYGFLQGETEEGDTGYCCLGVLQHVLEGEVECAGYGGFAGVPSLPWCSRRGLAPDFWSGSIDQTSLVELNDSGNCSFDEIADVIRERVVFEDGSRPIDSKSRP